MFNNERDMVYCVCACCPGSMENTEGGVGMCLLRERSRCTSLNVKGFVRLGGHSALHFIASLCVCAMCGTEAMYHL